MDDSLLWEVALWTGVFGLLILSVAGLVAVAVYLRTGPRRASGSASADKSQARARSATSAGKPQARAESAVSADKARARASTSDAQPKTIGSPWAWIKAWIFAIVHASTVSMVLGGITFFEDLARAGEEIQHTGAVTFPTQLLPGGLSLSTPQKPLSRPSGDLLRSGDRPDAYERHGATGAEAEDPDQSGAPPPDGEEWEVVDLPD
jgi:hypothetical protein